MSDEQNNQEHIENAPEGSVDAAAARIAAGRAPEPEVELPEPELQPMSEQETETLVQQDRRRELEDYRLRLTHEQARLAQREHEIAAMREYDPAEYSAARWDFEAERQAFNNALAQFQQAVNGEQEAATKKAQQELLNETEALKKAVPGWDKTKQEKLVKWLLRQGYSREQIFSVNDHRVVATFWREMERSGKKTLPQKKKAIPKPASHNDPQLLADLQRRNVRKDSLQSAAERISALMGH